jgi:two-component system chemotaxis response regulator CheY
MKILIAEDDSVSRKYLDKVLSEYGECDLTIDGIEAVDAYLMAQEEGQPYDLLCLDIMMPKVHGFKVIKIIRNIEKKNKTNPIKIIIITALSQSEILANLDETDRNIAWFCKPFNQELISEALEKLNLV